MKADETEKIWKAIRGLQRFSRDELPAITGCKRAILKNYVSLLLASGYIKPVGKVEGNRAKKIYKLIKDTGPKPLRRRTFLYDPNINEVIPKMTKRSAKCG